MLPVRINDLHQEVARLTGSSLGAVAGVLKAYYTTIHEQLTTLGHSRIQVANLGTFSIKPQRLRQRLEKRQALQQRLQDSPVNDEYLTDVSKELDLLRAFQYQPAGDHGAVEKNGPEHHHRTTFGKSFNVLPYRD